MSGLGLSFGFVKGDGTKTNENEIKPPLKHVRECGRDAGDCRDRDQVLDVAVRYEVMGMSQRKLLRHCRISIFRRSTRLWPVTTRTKPTSTDTLENVAQEGWRGCARRRPRY
jgi:hypothetical protein